MTRAHPEVDLIRTRAELAPVLTEFREAGETLALVPTMGALHEGHLTLLDEARRRVDRVAVSIFVNPLQFAPDEDLDRYPRGLDRDVALAEARGASLIFAPESAEMYPNGVPMVQVSPGPLGELLCGRFRPGHFQGVLTVVARLFGLFHPAVAVFGRKDLQQAVLIRRMAADLELGVEVVTAPLLREWDGLALSSRNVYLTPEERADAVGLSQALEQADRAFREGERSSHRLASEVNQVLNACPRLRPQYVEVVEMEGLQAVEDASPGHVVAVAAYVGSTRLIDNLVLGAESPDPRLPAPGAGVQS